MNKAAILNGQNLTIVPDVVRSEYGAMDMYAPILMDLQLGYGFADIVARTAIVLSG